MDGGGRIDIIKIGNHFLTLFPEASQTPYTFCARHLRVKIHSAKPVLLRCAFAIPLQNLQ